MTIHSLILKIYVILNQAGSSDYEVTVGYNTVDQVCGSICLYTDTKLLSSVRVLYD